MTGGGTVRYDVSSDGVNAMLDAEFSGTGNSCVEVGPTSALARNAVDPGSIRPGGYVSGPTGTYVLPRS